MNKVQHKLQQFFCHPEATEEPSNINIREDDDRLGIDPRTEVKAIWWDRLGQ